ncbi:hypothetical protein CAEBREN_13441 [Caenorhabditis brenneri]|uniref:Uncharacterized protein n=1 Tax=Caenorhabditis brenneri TaxID=135651 RepID=G0PA32_CAEBE|nr:hypothetical protein CAEBREN_13441 [Caenorhabditis brenneri]
MITSMWGSLIQWHPAFRSL